MKKLLFLFTALLFISCSGDDDSSSNDTSINPPSWIQGVWLRESGSGIGFEFTKDDFCLVTGISKYCYKANIDLTIKNPIAEVNVYEEISDDRYLLELTLGAATTEYEFIKVSSTRISHLDVHHILQQ
jgi:hypothetical protein